MFIVKLMLRPWRKTPIQQIAAVFGLVCLTVFGGMLTQLTGELVPVIERIESEWVWTVTLKSEVKKTDEAIVVDQIRTSVGASAVKFEFVNTDMFLQKLAPKYPVLTEEIAHLGVDLETVVPRYVTFAGKLSSDAVTALRSNGAVDTVENSRDRFTQAIESLRALRWVSGAFILVVAFIALLLMIQIARVNKAVMADACKVMRQWGASVWMSRMPELGFILGLGLVVGMIGAIVTGLLGDTFHSFFNHISPALRDSESHADASAILIGTFLAGPVIGMVAMFLHFLFEGLDQNETARR